MTAVIRFAAKRHVTIGSGPMFVHRSGKPPLRAIVELDLSEPQTVTKLRAWLTTDGPNGMGHDDARGGLPVPTDDRRSRALVPG